MYAHPDFVRGLPESLTKLRKAKTASRRRLSKGASDDSDTGSESPGVRSVSPSPPKEVATNYLHPILRTEPAVSRSNPSRSLSQTWLSINAFALPSPQVPRDQPCTVFPQKTGMGRLDLLALAVEREGCFAT